MTKSPRQLRCHDGQTVVEFCLVATIAFSSLWLLGELQHWVWRRHTLSFAGFFAARQAAIHSTPIPHREAAIATAALAASRNQRIGPISIKNDHANSLILSETKGMSVRRQIPQWPK